MSYVVSTSPHLHRNITSAKIMRDVCVALLPALIASIAVFGAQSMLVTVVCVSAAIFSEALYEKICKLPNTIGDSSAIVTGFNALENFLADMVVFLVAALPFIAIVAAVVIVVRIIRKRRK